ncbi:MAG: protein translocase subunit SecF [Syntrophomonadaceae bacterium]|nr:protein translocase subunit SecF [Syntrophomonadaceae bacterium]
MSTIKMRKVFYILSLVLLIPAIVSLAYQGLNLGIDFTGGTLIHLRFEQKVDIEQVREVLGNENIGRDLPIQESGNNEFIIRTHDLSQEQSNKLMKGFQDELGEMQVLRNEKVGATMGKELTNKALISIGIASVLMLLYISFRFEFKFGVAAVLALLHNVIIVAGIFSIFQWEVDAAFVAALLTILGYSINDTIVVFDRIRENLRLRRKEPYDVIVDKSVLQTVNRSINTVLTVVFCLVALLVLGGSTIKFFILAMLMGVIIGCYSSICIASPLWYDLKVREG